MIWVKLCTVFAILPVISAGTLCDRPTLHLEHIGSFTFNPRHTADGKGEQFYRGRSFTYGCFRGYVENYSGKITCLNTGEWSQPAPYCRRAPPPPPPQPSPPPPPPPPPPKKEDCFPSVAKVRLESGKLIPMSELQIGDKVQTTTSAATVIYSEIITFLRKKPNAIANYKTITTSQNETLTLSGRHLIYVRGSSSNKFSTVYVDQIPLGHEVLIEENHELTPTKVINVSNIFMQGAYAPLTKRGTIVVDGVLASCYAVVDHDVSHIAMTPIQWFPETAKSIFGEDNGYPTGVLIAKEVASWMIPDEQFSFM